MHQPLFDSGTNTAEGFFRLSFDTVPKDGKSIAGSFPCLMFGNALSNYAVRAYHTGLLIKLNRSQQPDNITEGRFFIRTMVVVKHDGKQQFLRRPRPEILFITFSCGTVHKQLCKVEKFFFVRDIGKGVVGVGILNILQIEQFDLVAVFPQKSCHVTVQFAGRVGNHITAGHLDNIRLDFAERFTGTGTANNQFIQVIRFVIDFFRTGNGQIKIFAARDTGIIREFIFF